MERDARREEDGFPRKIRIGKLVKPSRSGQKVVVVPTTVEEKLVHDNDFAQRQDGGGEAGGSGEGEEGEVIGEQPVRPEQGEGDGEGPGPGRGRTARAREQRLRPRPHPHRAVRPAQPRGQGPQAVAHPLQVRPHRSQPRLRPAARQEGHPAAHRRDEHRPRTHRAARRTRPRRVPAHRPARPGLPRALARARPSNRRPWSSCCATTPAAWAASPPSWS